MSKGKAVTVTSLTLPLTSLHAVKTRSLNLLPGFKRGFEFVFFIFSMSLVSVFNPLDWFCSLNYDISQGGMIYLWFRH